jgi:hypothetical protein
MISRDRNTKAHSVGAQSLKRELAQTIYTCCLILILSEMYGARYQRSFMRPSAASGVAEVAGMALAALTSLPVALGKALEASRVKGSWHHQEES